MKNSPVNSRDYFEEQIQSSEIGDGTKLKLIYQLGEAASQSLTQSLDKAYQSQTFQSKEDTTDDEAFLEEAQAQIDTLVRRLIDVYVNGQKEIAFRANDTTLPPLTALLAFASIQSLDHILDSSNGFMTGLEDGGQYNIDSQAGRTAAINEIAEDLKFKPNSTNFSQKIA